ncbi:MAG: hypothetical protein LUE27_08050 [Clostridia bacterium]|nr:hypothetical protein [Clostridia bacterium]
MRKRVFGIICAAFALLLSCLCLAGCASPDEGNKYLFAFLSVRMKGNGDGTITAYAKNEFDIGPAIQDVELTVYYSEEYSITPSSMEAVASEKADVLKAFKEICIPVEARNGYYCSVVTYPITGLERTLQSETMHYDSTGTRI